MYHNDKENSMRSDIESSIYTPEKSLSYITNNKYINENTNTIANDIMNTENVLLINRYNTTPIKQKDTTIDTTRKEQKERNLQTPYLSVKTSQKRKDTMIVSPGMLVRDVNTGLVSHTQIAPLSKRYMNDVGAIIKPKTIQYNNKKKNYNDSIILDKYKDNELKTPCHEIDNRYNIMNSSDTLRNYNNSLYLCKRTLFFDTSNQDDSLDISLPQNYDRQHHYSTYNTTQSLPKYKDRKSQLLEQRQKTLINKTQQIRKRIRDTIQDNNTIDKELKKSFPKIKSPCIKHQQHHCIEEKQEIRSPKLLYNNRQNYHGFFDVILEEDAHCYDNTTTATTITNTTATTVSNSNNTFETIEKIISTSKVTATNIDTPYNTENTNNYKNKKYNTVNTIQRPYEQNDKEKQYECSYISNGDIYINSDIDEDIVSSTESIVNNTVDIIKNNNTVSRDKNDRVYISRQINPFVPLFSPIHQLFNRKICIHNDTIDDDTSNKTKSIRMTPISVHELNDQMDDLHLSVRTPHTKRYTKQSYENSFNSNNTINNLCLSSGNRSNKYDLLQQTFNSNESIHKMKPNAVCRFTFNQSEDISKK